MAIGRTTPSKPLLQTSALSRLGGRSRVRLSNIRSTIGTNSDKRRLPFTIWKPKVTDEKILAGYSANSQNRWNSLKETKIEHYLSFKRTRLKRNEIHNITTWSKMIHKALDQPQPIALKTLQFAPNSLSTFRYQLALNLINVRRLKNSPKSSFWCMKLAPHLKLYKWNFSNCYNRPYTAYSQNICKQLSPDEFCQALPIVKKTVFGMSSQRHTKI